MRAYKISKRFDCDISAVCAGLAIELDGDGIGDAARLAFGGMAATVKRAARRRGRAGRPALGRGDAVAAAQAALASDFAPLTDMRASAAYRLQVAQNLLRRFWLETRPNAPLAPSETSVWSVDGACRPPRRAPRRRREPLARAAVAAPARRQAPTAGVGASLPHESAHLHVAGAAPYVDDLPELAGTLHAALGLSPVAHGRLRRDRPRRASLRCPASSRC